MINDTKRRIEEAKALLPGIKERIIAVGLMLAMSVAMVASSSYAWLTISRSPEAKGMSTTITGNGNLEISLVPSDGSLPGNADGSTTDLLSTNITWGNLVNLSDQRYGLDQIALRPALLSQYNLTTAPLYGATYGADGRVSGTSEKYSFASFTTAEDGTYYFEDTVRVETLPGSLKFYKQGMGTLIQTPEGTTVKCNYYGEEYTLFRSAKSLESMHIEYDYLGRGDCVDISIPDDSFWCYLSKRDAITKISFATEEMHLLAVRKAREV